MKKLSTKKIALMALFMALTMVATMFMRVPLSLGYVNLGDAFVLLSIFVLGPVCGTVSAGVGSALADLFGYVTYAPGTLVIKSLMAMVAWLVYSALKRATQKQLLAEIAAGIVGAVTMALGYFLYETLLFTTAQVAAVNIPWNLLQGAVGVVVSVMVMRVLTATGVLVKLNEEN